MKKYFAEFLATFCLIFLGTGVGIIENTMLNGGNMGLSGVAVVWGITVAGMIYAFGSISGAHMNPAVTITFWMVKLFKAREVIPYIVSQLLGALAASLTLRTMFPQDRLLGTTHPAIDPVTAFIIEIFMAFILMLVILFTSQGSKETGVLSGLAVGGIILVEVLFAGPLTNASMNPTRSLAPAIASINFKDIWIYLTAPFLGMFAAGIVWMVMKEQKK